MAENKKSFLLYCDLIHTVSKMPDDKAGQLLKHVLEYVNDLNPQTEDLIIQLTFEPIKQQLKRDLLKYKAISEERSEIGKLGGIKSGEARRNKTKQNEAIALKSKQNEQDTDTDTVIDSVKDKDTVKEIVKEKKINTKSSSEIKISVHQSYGFIKDSFLIYYKEKKGLDYYFQSKDGNKINSIIKKLLSQIKTTYPNLAPEKETEQINKAFKFILEQLKDDWIIDNLELSIIDSKFNTIISKIKNPTNGKQSVTERGKSELAKVLANIAAE